MNFISANSSYSSADIVLFGAPFDSTTSFRPGTRFGPAAMRSESFGIETYSPYQDRDLEDIRMISDLRIQPEESVSFRFRDRQIRAWLRDVGSVLELFVYKSCFDSGLFDDVITSAVVDWNGTKRNSAVSNELDVMCTRGVIPVFISCKTSLVRTEALNELAILRDRFGGKMARAALVTAERAGSPARNRAAELNIRIIDLNDIQDGDIQTNLRSLMV